MKRLVQAGFFAALVLASALTVHAKPRTPDPTAAIAAERSFAQLKSLVGAWRGTWSDGRPVGLTYRLSAGGTVLVETWTLSPTRESLTLYHMDGNALLATHYCPQGNQPRLRLAGTAGSHLTFTFRDVTDLDVASESYQHAFSLHLDGPDRIARRETYRKGKVDETDTVVFHRIAATP